MAASMASRQLLPTAAIAEQQTGMGLPWPHRPLCTMVLKLAMHCWVGPADGEPHCCRVEGQQRMG